jgi:hypothetical protein
VFAKTFSFLREMPIFADNWRKSQKIMIITSTRDVIQNTLLNLIEGPFVHVEDIQMQLNLGPMLCFLKYFCKKIGEKMAFLTKNKATIQKFDISISF